MRSGPSNVAARGVSSRTILARLVRRFWVLVLLTIVGGAAGAAYSAVKTPTYLAQSYVVATGEPGEATAALNFAQAYGRIATKGPVTDRAAAALGSKDGLNRVTAQTSPDAPVIEIQATGSDAKRTAAVADAVAKALVEYGTTSSGQTRVTLSVLAPASVPKTPTSPRPPLELAIGAGAGLLIGALTVLAGIGRGPAPAPQPAPGPAARLMPPGATRYEVTEFSAPAAAGPALVGTEQQAITWYQDPVVASGEAAAAPDGAQPAVAEWMVGEGVEDVSDQPGVEKIVGRAVVIYRSTQ